MDAVLNQIVTFVQAQGGSATYAQIIEALPFESRSKAYNALRLGKKQGVLRKFVRVDDTTKAADTIVELLPQEA